MQLLSISFLATKKLLLPFRSRASSLSRLDTANPLQTLCTTAEIKFDQPVQFDRTDLTGVFESSAIAGEAAKLGIASCTMESSLRP